MPALAPAIVLALAAQWGAPVAPRQILAQARIESGLDPLAIHDDVTGRVYHPVSLAQAIRIATHCEMDGHDIDAGLLQINSGNFAWLHLSLAEAFDPVQSIRAGARVLTAISTYNTGSPARGFENGYVQRVVAAERATPLHGRGDRSHGTPRQPQPRPVPGLHNDLIDALIKPPAIRPATTPMRQPAPAAAGQADQQAEPQDGATTSSLIDPLIHPQAPRPSAPVGLSKAAGDG